MPKPITVQEFWDRSTPEPNTGCWLWTGSKTHQGYGKVNITFGGYRHRFAARLSWQFANNRMLAKGDRSTCVLHRCDTPSCINPDHLFLGTNQDNCTDRDRKGRQASRVGSKNQAAKLTESQVIEMRMLKAKGAKVAVLMAHFGVSSSSVVQICNYTKWPHLKGHQ